RVNYRKSASSPFLATGGNDGHQTALSEEMAKQIDQEGVRILEEVLAHTREILEQRREALEAGTQRLLEVESIDNEEPRRLPDAHSPPPWLVPGTRAETPRAQIRAPQNPGIDIAPTADNQI